MNKRIHWLYVSLTPAAVVLGYLNGEKFIDDPNLINAIGFTASAYLICRGVSSSIKLYREIKEKSLEDKVK